VDSGIYAKDLFNACADKGMWLIVEQKFLSFVVKLQIFGPPNIFQERIVSNILNLT
jgi:hypothetical protein